MHLLTPITELQTKTISRGRHSGNKTYFKFAVCGDKFNWVFSRLVFNDKGEITNEQGLKYYSNFGALFGGILRVAEYEGLTSDLYTPQDVFNIVNKTLSKMRKIDLLEHEPITEDNFIEAGNKLTDHYGVHYCRVKDNPGEGTLAGILFKGHEEIKVKKKKTKKKK